MNQAPPVSITESLDVEVRLVPVATDMASATSSSEAQSRVLAMSADLGGIGVEQECDITASIAWRSHLAQRPLRRCRSGGLDRS